MKHIKSFRIFESINYPNYVYRIDPIDRKGDLWKRSDYSLIGTGGKIQGTSPLRPGQNVGDSTPEGHEIYDIEKGIAFATPHRPNAFYAACPRKGKDGRPVSGTALYDEDKMYGNQLDLKYKGVLHITKHDYDNIPDKILVSKADGKGWTTKEYSGKDEVTSSEPATNVSSVIEDTKKLVSSQYDIVIHRDQNSVDNAVENALRENPGLSVLKQ